MMKRRIGFLVKLSKDFGEEGYEVVDQVFVGVGKIYGLEDISLNILVELFNSYFKPNDKITLLGESEINLSYFYNGDLKHYSYPALMFKSLSDDNFNTYKVSADKVYCSYFGDTVEESLFIDLDDYMFDRILNFNTKN